MIDIDALFGEQFLDVAVGRPVAQLPPHRHCDHFWWETRPGERSPQYRCADMTAAHQTTLPDLRSANASAPIAEVGDLVRCLTCSAVRQGVVAEIRVLGIRINSIHVRKRAALQENPLIAEQSKLPLICWSGRR